MMTHPGCEYDNLPRNVLQSEAEKEEFSIFTP